MSTANSQTYTGSNTSQKQVRGGTKSPCKAQTTKWGQAAQPSKNYTVYDLDRMLHKVGENIKQTLASSFLANSTEGVKLNETYLEDLSSIRDNFVKLFSFKDGAKRGTYKSGHLNKLTSLRSRVETIRDLRGTSAEEWATADRCSRWIVALRAASVPLSSEWVRLLISVSSWLTCSSSSDSPRSAT